MWVYLFCGVWNRNAKVAHSQLIASVFMRNNLLLCLFLKMWVRCTSSNIVCWNTLTSEIYELAQHILTSRWNSSMITWSYCTIANGNCFIFRHVPICWVDECKVNRLQNITPCHTWTWGKQSGRIIMRKWHKSSTLTECCSRHNNKVSTPSSIFILWVLWTYFIVFKRHTYLWGSCTLASFF